MAGPVQADPAVRGLQLRIIPENVRVALSVYGTPSLLKGEWQRRDLLDDMIIDGVKFTRIELMWIFKKLIQEIQK